VDVYNAANDVNVHGAAGQALWDAVTAEYEIRDAGGIEILAQACATSDRIAELAERISAAGPVCTPAADPIAPGVAGRA
jgi:hypothetical protein